MVNMGNVWDRTTEFLGENLGAILPLAAIAIFVPQSISGGMKLAGTGMSPAAAQGIALAMLLPTLWGQLGSRFRAVRIPQITAPSITTPPIPAAPGASSARRMRYGS